MSTSQSDLCCVRPQKVNTYRTYGLLSVVQLMTFCHSSQLVNYSYKYKPISQLGIPLSFKL